jgi:hypothetical protein
MGLLPGRGPTGDRRVNHSFAVDTEVLRNFGAVRCASELVRELLAGLNRLCLKVSALAVP